jgi:hypothetical protein
MARKTAEVTDMAGESETVTVAAGGVVSEPEISLDEFCLSISRTDRRVELLAGFHLDERAHGRLRGAASVYRQRLAEYAARPVG